MAVVGSIRITGGRQLQRELLALDKKLRNKIMRKAIRDGAKVVLKGVKGEAPKRSGLLYGSHKIKAGKRKKNTIRLRVQTAAGDYKGDTFYGAFVQYGHKIGSRKLGGSRKSVPANDYMTRGFNKSKKTASAVMEESLRHGLALKGGKVRKVSGFTGRKFKK